MNRNTLTTVKADARIQRCVINDPFHNYKPEEEKCIKQFKVEKNETLGQLKNAFMNSERISRGAGVYEKTVSLIKNIKYSSTDITAFSLALAEFQGEEKFSERAGLFLSAIINRSKEKRFTVITEHLEPPIDCIGFKNRKNITVHGNVGGWIGYKMKGGSITIQGNVGYEAGQWMERGSIIIRGNTGARIGYKMKGGSIHLEGEYKSLDSDITGGNIFHKGVQIVKNGKVLI